IVRCREALDSATPVRFAMKITNTNRTVGTMLGHEVTKAYGGEGLPNGTIDITFSGSAGNSFGAFVPRGITLRVHGDANDYVGKGLSGGRIVLRPSDNAPQGYIAEDNIIGGNVILFGATSGEAFIRGTVGERFAVRNSGAHAVVEGVGDHGCEYMTGGKVVILGPTGRNFAAGMSGGVAYVYDPQSALPGNLNPEMVDIEKLTDDDVESLREMLAAHRDATDSAVAPRVLADWPRQAGDFVKVMPRDYKRVLAAIAEAERTGADVDEMIMAASRG
ncbi:MAG: glutamate synthase subunit alpha, partial [Mycobacterium sp.]